MRLRLAASLWTLALLSATGAVAEMKAVRIPPSFTLEEIEVIGRDARLAGAAKRCASELRQAFDALAALRAGSRIGVPAPEPCQGGTGRASDEGALDIMQILKDVSEKKTSRSDEVGDKTVGLDGQPLFTGEEIQLLLKDKSGQLMDVAVSCSRQLRQALDALKQGRKDWRPETPCTLPPSRSGDEGALDIMKILRDASGEAN